MNTPPTGLPDAVPLPGKLKDKRLLLVDSSATMRERRAPSMRKVGMEVDCAADISEARSWWQCARSRTPSPGKSVPPRDVETREFKRAAAESRTLDDLLREELQ